MKNKKNLIFAAGMLCFSISSCIITPCYATETASDSVSVGIPFSELTYEPFDNSELNALISEIRDKMNDAANIDEISGLLEQIDEQYNRMDQAYTLADLYSYLDVTDDYYADQESAMYSLYCTIDDELNSLYRDLLSSPCGEALSRDLTANDVDYYESYVELSEEQLSLAGQEQSLISQYEELYNQDFTTIVNGEECTLYDLGDLYDAGNLTRDEYYDAYMDLMQNENDVLGPVYVELVKVRNQLAAAYGYDNYTEYAYAETYLRDYTPEDASVMEEEVKEYLINAYNTAYEKYDSDAVSRLDDQLASMSIEEQMDLIAPYFKEIDPELSDNFTFLRENQLYDMEYSDTKIDTGFTVWLADAEEPFIYNQPYESFYDLDTLIHEFGHFNAMLTEGYDVTDLDLAEIHSQGLVMLYSRFYSSLFDSSLTDAAVNYELLNIMESITDGCLYDEFQQKVYELDDPTLDEINQIYYDTSVAYGNDYNGYTTAYEWVDIPHNFSDPLYYISYATSAVPSLELWNLMQTDPDNADEIYMEIVYSGDYDTYQNTLANCGLPNPFEEGTIEDLSNNLLSYLK